MYHRACWHPRGPKRSTSTNPTSSEEEEEEEEEPEPEKEDQSRTEARSCYADLRRGRRGLGK